MAPRRGSRGSRASRAPPGSAGRGSDGRLAGGRRRVAVGSSRSLRGVPSYRDARPLAQREPLAPLPGGARRSGAGGAAAAFPGAPGALGEGDAVTVWLDFEKPVIELEEKIEELKASAAERGVDAGAALKDLERKADALRREIYASLSRYQRVQ